MKLFELYMTTGNGYLDDREESTVLMLAEDLKDAKEKAVGKVMKWYKNTWFFSMDFSLSDDLKDKVNCYEVNKDGSIIAKHLEGGHDRWKSVPEFRVKEVTEVDGYAIDGLVLRKVDK